MYRDWYGRICPHCKRNLIPVPPPKTNSKEEDRKPLRDLTVKLSLDTSEFDSALKELNKTIEDISKGITRCFSQQMYTLSEEFKKLGEKLKPVIKPTQTPQGYIEGYDGYDGLIDIRTREEISNVK